MGPLVTPTKDYLYCINRTRKTCPLGVASFIGWVMNILGVESYLSSIYTFVVLIFWGHIVTSCFMSLLLWLMHHVVPLIMS